ncbi:hypothetical protein SEA_THERESITA_38 [Microbacterium phage Theresita]|nr:hypothetical protein SEA_THERESITA_38 [Microbacterium phage Theresita]
MAKLILGEKPDIQVKSFKHTLSAEFIARVDQVELESILDAKARQEAVPSEATKMVWYDPAIDATVYSWRWWEVTI